MRIKILKTDESEYWCEEIRRQVKRIWGVYLFDPNWRVHLCEFTPSYELHRLHSEAEFLDGTSDETKEAIEEAIFEAERFDEAVVYMHTHDIDRLPRFREGCFPTGSAGIYTMTGFAREIAVVRSVNREARHEAAIEEAIEYCGQNGV